MPRKTVLKKIIPCQGKQSLRIACFRLYRFIPCYFSLYEPLIWFLISASIHIFHFAIITNPPPPHHQRNKKKKHEPKYQIAFNNLFDIIYLKWIFTMILFFSQFDPYLNFSQFKIPRPLNMMYMYVEKSLEGNLIRN